MEDAIAANGSVTRAEESNLTDNQISEGIVNTTPEVQMSDNTDRVPKQGLIKDGEHGVVTNNTNISNTNIEHANHDKIVNTEGKTDSNEDDQANSNEDTDKKVDGNLNSETNTSADVSNKIPESSTKDAEDGANVKESPQDGVESVTQNYNYNADSDIASDEPGELPERKTSITWADSYNDKRIESPDLDASDGPLPTETSESNTERVQDDSVPKSALDQTQSESVKPEEDQASPPKTDDNFEERQSPEGSSNDSPRPSSPRNKKDSVVKTIEDDQDNQQELDQKKDVEAVQQSQDQPAKDDDDESSDPKADSVKPIDDDGLMIPIKANEVNTSSSQVTSSEEIPKSSEESTDREQKGEVQSSEDAPESSEDEPESSENAPESSENAPEPLEDSPELLKDASDPLTDKTGDNKPELNSESTKRTDQQLDSEHKQDDKDAQDNRQSDNDSPPESKTFSDGDGSKFEHGNGHKESDSVESNIAVVKPMMRSSSQEEDRKGKELETVPSVETSGTSPQADKVSSNDEENSSENTKNDSEEAADEPESNVDASTEQNGEELSTVDEIPVGQPPLATHLQTGNSKSEHKTDTNLESEKHEPAKSDNDLICPRDDNDDGSDNELDNDRENNNPSPGVINKTGDNEDVDEVKEHNVEVKDNSEDTENNEVTPSDNINEDTENNESKEVTSTDEVKEVISTDEVKEVTPTDEVKEVTLNNDEIGNIEVAPHNDEVTEQTESNKVKGEMIHEFDIRENSDQSNETLKASDEEKTKVIAQTESPLEEAEEAKIQPETAQKLGSAVQDDKKGQPAQNETPGVLTDTNESKETTEDQNSTSEVEVPQKKTSVSSQTTEEKDTTPEVEPVPEEVQKDDFSKWLLEEEVEKSEETSNQRGQDRTPTPVRKPTPEPETEEISTAEEYKEQTPEEKKAEEMENNKRGNDDDKGEARAGTNQRGVDSQNKEINLPKETEVQKVDDKPGKQQDPKPPQSNKSQVDPPQTRRKVSVKQNGANNQKSIGRRRTVRAPKPIQSEKPKEEKKRPEQRSRLVEANKPASRQRPITREKTAPPPNKGSTGNRPETTNGRMRKTSTSSNGRLLQRETTRTSQKSQRPKTTGVRESADGRAEQNEFFKKELTRIEEGLKKEVSKIQKPTQKKHTPFIFNDLKPYYDTSSQRYLIQTPEEQQHYYASRTMAIGLIDPWKNLEMDKSVLPVLESKPVNRGETQKKKEKKIDERTKKTKHEGSTRLPKYPVVTLETSDLATKKLYYSDVPMLREELKQKYSANATKKVEEDYEKTKQDFYRMDLDKLNEVHPVNREHMRSTYFAYLQNTPGSKKAINECVKSIDKTEKAN